MYRRSSAPRLPMVLAALSLLTACPAPTQEGLGDGGRDAGGHREQVLSAAERGGVTILFDERCHQPACDPGPRLARLRHLLPELEVERCPWSEERCQRLFRREGLGRLPAFLFGRSILTAPAFKGLAGRLNRTPKGDLLMLRQREGRDPRREICDDGRDDDGDGKRDCEDGDCQDSPLCRPLQAGRLDLFFRLDALASAQALASAGPLHRSLGPELDLRIHMLPARRPGAAEQRERLLAWRCALAHAADLESFLDFARCEFEKGGDCLKGWAGRGALDACRRGEEGLSLLQADARLGSAMGVRGTPRWMVNNRYAFRANAPEFVRQAFCERNVGWKGCEKHLPSRAPWPRPGSMRP